MSRRLAMEYLEALDEIFGQRNDGYIVNPDNDLVMATYHLDSFDGPDELTEKQAWARRAGLLHDWTPIHHIQYFGEKREDGDMFVCFKRKCDT